MIKVIDIRVTPAQHASRAELRFVIVDHLNLTADFDFRVLKRSIDARPRYPVYQLRVEVAIDEKLPVSDLAPPLNKDISNGIPVHIVGAGPTGLFAALQCIEKGLKPILFERGKTVRDRRRDLALLNRVHLVNPESNYCFGEGGAGTYSDGKLYTRSDKRGDIKKVLHQLIQFGADPEIRIDSHPHIGTNKLPKVIENIRNYIISCGGIVHFESKLTDFFIEDKNIKSIVINDEQEHDVQHLLLATGHSARDIFQLLDRKKIAIENKPFALGVRIEHPQSLINSIQYRKGSQDPHLPPASYNLVTQTDRKAVYSFCMCPGGIIAPCATAPGEVVTNGWSPSKRNNPFANSGIVIPVDESDWMIYQKEFGNLAALEFQKRVEIAAWKVGGKTQAAPAQRLVDFMEDNISERLPKTSYQPGIQSADLRTVLPDKFSTALKKGFKDFVKKMPAYHSQEAVLHATESRTSSPVKIPRDPTAMNHPDLKNFYPCGEGAGYAGGIMSAAIDGVKVIETIANL